MQLNYATQPDVSYIMSQVSLYLATHFLAKNVIEDSHIKKLEFYITF